VSSSATLVDGFASTQSVVLPCPIDAFEVLAQPARLAGMLRDYFSVAERCTLGLVRIKWLLGKPRFVTVWPGVTLLAMSAPTSELGGNRRAINVAVEGGLLVGAGAAGRLSIVLERRAQFVHASVELVGYQPRFSHQPRVVWIHGHTQANVHAWVGRRYLRELSAQCMGRAA